MTKQTQRFFGDIQTDFRIGDTQLVFNYSTEESKILELSPFYGLFTKQLIDRGYKNIECLDWENDMTHTLIRPKIADLSRDEFPYKDNIFDLAVSWGRVEHLENLRHFFKETARVIKPGGYFIFSIPNIFHIMSRLMFLKKGMFPRWDETNNHIALLPMGVFEKITLRHFDLIETKYLRPEVVAPPSWFWKHILFPANQWFGSEVVYVLRKKSNKCLNSMSAT